ncbi:hypothetical protein C8R45DRAFT_1110931 [Mycena sanguinolenta]|nr:hypothetical protein C8R45DRAFT_1110931 [Mycena sanguinolenta]
MTAKNVPMRSVAVRNWEHFEIFGGSRLMGFSTTGESFTSQSLPLRSQRLTEPIFRDPAWGTPTTTDITDTFTVQRAANLRLVVDDGLFSVIGLTRPLCSLHTFSWIVAMSPAVFWTTFRCSFILRGIILWLRSLVLGDTPTRH